MSSWSDFDSLNFWESSWIMRYVSPYSSCGGGNAGGSISVSSSSGSRPTNNSGSKVTKGTGTIIMMFAKPRELVPDAYETALINALIKDPTNQELMREYVAAGGHISEELGPLSPYNLSGKQRLFLYLATSVRGKSASFPDAISIEFNKNASGGVSTNTSLVGVMIKKNPSVNGDGGVFFSSSGGFGTVDASANIRVTAYYFVGKNSKDLEMTDLAGRFTSIDVGGDAIVSAGGAVSFSSPINGAKIIGVSFYVGIGVSTTAISGSFTHGFMDYYKNY
jgi:hypothetical protein